MDKKDAYKVFGISNDVNIEDKVDKVRLGKKLLGVYSDNEHKKWIGDLERGTKEEKEEEINETLALIQYELNRVQMQKGVNMQEYNRAIQSILGLESSTPFWSADIFGETIFVDKDKRGRDVVVNHFGELRCALSEAKGKQKVDTETYDIDFETYLDMVGIVKINNGETIESSTIVFADDINKLDMVTAKQKDSIINRELTDERLAKAMENTRYIGMRNSKVDPNLKKSAKVAFILEGAEHQEGEIVDRVSGLIAKPESISSMISLFEKAQRNSAAKTFGIEETEDLGRTQENNGYFGDDTLVQ